MPVGCGQVEAMHVGRRIAHFPHVKEFAVGVEYLNTVIVPVVHENSAAWNVDGYSVHAIKIAWTRLVGGRSLHAPVAHELAVLVEFLDPRADVSFRYEHRAVRQPGEIGGSREMRG